MMLREDHLEGTLPLLSLTHPILILTYHPQPLAKSVMYVIKLLTYLGITPL